MTHPGLNDDFVDMLRCLGEAGVDFVIVGAHAMAVHGIPRATGDIDLFVRPTEANARALMQALAAFGAPIAAHGVQQADFTTPGTVYQIGLPPRRVDILTQISGVTFDEAWATRVTVETDGGEVSFLGRQALLKNKRAADRDKDRVDVKLLTP